MAKQTVTWYVIADGTHAKILACDGPGKPLRKAVRKEYTLDLPHNTRDIMSDAKGRAVATGGAYHAWGPQTDPRAHLEEEFLREVARKTGEAAQKGRYQRLIIVAEPRALGTLRAHLPQVARERVAGELDKDLTHLPDADLRTHLEKAGLLV